MSANLIGFGADLQQKLDAMDPALRKARWAGDVGVALYRIAKELHRLRVKGRRARTRAAADRAERRLMQQARQEADKLGNGIVVVRQPDPRAWPMVVVFPDNVPPESGPEAVFEQGVAVPPRP